jgi:hypothetical protein
VDKASLREYKQGMINRILDAEKWPAFEEPDFLDGLDAIAQQAIMTDTVEGYLAAIVIYHQLAEEMILLLIQDSDFLLQAQAFPFAYKRKQLKKVVFGRTLGEFRDATVDFWLKDKISTIAKKLNRIRNKAVHKLVKAGSLEHLKRDAEEAHALHDELFESFDLAHDRFRQFFHGISKDFETFDMTDLLDETLDGT